MQTLSVEVNKQTKIKIGLPIPLFRRTKDESEFIGLLDDKTLVKIFKSGSMSYILNTELNDHNTKDVVEAWEKWESCTETEFLEKYDSVIESISLHPKLAV